MKLCIMYLTDSRRHYTFKPFIDLLNLSLNKDKWLLCILTHDSDGEFYQNIMKNTDILYKIAKVQNNNNYMIKVSVASNLAKYLNIPYIMKCDNDILLSAHVLDYMINNLNVLETDKYLTLGPSLSSGIPSVEYFRKSFLNAGENLHLESLFKQTRFYDRDGAIYSNLNKYTLNSEKWIPADFFMEVKKSNHHYKGVHPIRFNEESIKYINKCIIQKKDLIFSKSDYSIIEDVSSPYLCDSIFCIKTERYIELLNDKTLFVDEFDEVPLNKYAWKNKMGHLFVNNGNAIHINYNWNTNIQQYEYEFIQQLFN